MIEPAVSPDWRRAPVTMEPLALAAAEEMALSPALDRELGIAVHRALAHWQRAVDGGTRVSGSKLLATVTAEAARQGLVPADVERALGRLGPALHAYAEGPWPRRHTLFLEQPVRHVLRDDDFELELSLRVDRVVRYRRGVAILDFKTVPPHVFEARADAWQLCTYALAAPELLGLEPGKVALFILDLANDREIPVDNDAEHLAAAREELLGSARDISAGNFEIGAGHADRPCWSCGFRLTCPASLAPDPPAERPSARR